MPAAPRRDPGPRARNEGTRDATPSRRVNRVDARKEVVMALLTRFDPFKPMTRMAPWTDLDDMFRGLGLRTLPREFENVPEIRMDVDEDEKFYKVKAEIPGVRKDDIEVSIEGDQVTIS